MKKMLKIIGVILLTIIIIISLVIFSSDTSKISGSIQNSIIAESEVNNPTITFVGDSITNGYYSDSNLQYDADGYRGYVTDKTNANANNFAVGGYETKDLLNQLNSDVTINDVNKVIRNKTDAIKDDRVYDKYKDVENNISLSESIKNSDYVVVTIGSNDIISSVLSFDENGDFTVKGDVLNSSLQKIRKEKEEIYSKIHAINPNVKIIDVGMYLAYPHISNTYIHALYPILMYVENNIFFDNEELNVYKVTIRDNIQADATGYIDNPNDIHPNQKGHDVIGNEVLKVLNKLNNK